MLKGFSEFIDSLAPSTNARRDHPLHMLGVVIVAVGFVVLATLIVAFDSIFQTANNVSALQIGSVASEDIHAPISITYTSEVLTQRARDAAVAGVSPVYDPPDPNVARQQITLLQQILDFIDNVRHDSYATPQQKASDIGHITALQLDPTIIQSMVQMDDDTWSAVEEEADNVLEREMRESIRDSDLPLLRSQLPSQVSVRFDTQTTAVIVALVQDLLRTNRFLNSDATELARQTAQNNVAPQSLTYQRGQVVVRAGAPLSAVDYEALSHLGLLASPSLELQNVAQAFLASVIVMVTIGLYLARFSDKYYTQARFLGLLAAIFLVTLAAARLFGGQYYIYPAAAMALTLVIVTRNEVAIISTIGLGLLVGVMAGSSLEIATMIIVGGIVGSLILRRSERLNSYFLAGLVIALVNVVVVTLFNLELLTGDEGVTFGSLILMAVLNGVISAMAALAAMYVITLVFNLPTSLKLVELSQPNQPLLQRLLREAPGTYQHSLQVANLSEQAANAVGADADLMRVAALYHDIGKMLNPAFFVENQADNVNPHDSLGDPYRSADIIISHVTDGEKLARQYHLPVRIRDFIMEHHGTTLVGYFYTKAVEQADDQEAVDIEQFTYPGPKPQSRETAIMMLADSCESTVRARKPANKAEIVEIVDSIIENRMRDGQLDESGLTLNDISQTRDIFIEMLQAVFHPRINYPSLPATTRRQTAELVPEVAAPVKEEVEVIETIERLESGVHQTGEHEAVSTAAARSTRITTAELPAVKLEDDTPMSEVPPLKRTQRLAPVEPQGEPNGGVRHTSPDADTKSVGEQHAAPEDKDH
ncbi:MAG TPA: HDIG domain-containing protein [Phototrophicaceae bacterium]|nr:HDIG domain-containing protein [Phototrophicaceae bacterium]